MKAETIERLEGGLGELDVRLPRRKTFELDLERLEREPVTRVDGTLARSRSSPCPKIRGERRAVVPLSRRKG
jgi:hypothetical protein